MCAVFARHAEPGAALMITSGPKAGEALFHTSLSPAEYHDLLAVHGFEVVAHIAEDPNCGGHTIWLARHVQS